MQSETEKKPKKLPQTSNTNTLKHPQFPGKHIHGTNAALQCTGLDPTEDVASSKSKSNKSHCSCSRSCNLGRPRPIPVHPALHRIQTHLRATLPRSPDGSISQSTLFDICAPYAVFLSIFLLGVIIPRNEDFKPLLHEWLDGGNYGWRERLMDMLGLVGVVVVSGLVAFRIYIWMAVRLLEDWLQLELVDAKTEGDEKLTHKELLVGGLLA